jgi:hypothetical protein
MENGMLFDFRGRGRRRDRLLFTCQATIPAVIILMTAVSCARPGADMPPPVGILELFSGRVTEAPKLQAIQRDEAPPKVRRAQPRTTAPPKVAKVHAPNTTSRPVSPGASVKANTPPRPNAERERQLFEEFLEWRSRQKDLQ